MDDVKGLLVTLVKKPVIPHKISKFVSLFVRLNKPAVYAPMLAPALNAGANMPPAALVENEMIGLTNLKIGTCNSVLLWPENKLEIMVSFPDPNTL